MIGRTEKIVSLWRRSSEMSRIVSFGTTLISGVVLFLLMSPGADASEKKEIATPVDVREVSTRKSLMDCVLPP